MELAAVQYHRGMPKGTAEFFDNEFRAIVEDLRKATSETKDKAEAKPDT
jgi:hypothetical protein